MGKIQINDQNNGKENPMRNLIKGKLKKMQTKAAQLVSETE